MSQVCRPLSRSGSNEKKPRAKSDPSAGGDQRSQKLLNKQMSERHRIADQRWRHNINRGFTALKTIVKKDRKKSLERVMTSAEAKSVVADKKRNKSEKMSRINVLKATIGLIEDKESQIENILNERQQKQMEKSTERVATNGKPSVAFSGLQKIREAFFSFEKRHELEASAQKPFIIEDKPKFLPKIKEEIIESKPKVTPVVNDGSKSSPCKTYDPLLTAENVHSSDPIEILIEIHANPLPDISQEPIDQWIQEIVGGQPVVVDPQMNANHTLHYSFFNNQNSNHSYTLLANKSLNVEEESNHSVDANQSSESLAIDSKSFVSTDLSELLAANIPNSPFGSLNCLSDSYTL